MLDFREQCQVCNKSFFRIKCLNDYLGILTGDIIPALKQPSQALFEYILCFFSQNLYHEIWAKNIFEKYKNKKIFKMLYIPLSGIIAQNLLAVLLPSLHCVAF